MADLLPCPFCGGTNLSVVGAWVECECCAFGPGREDADPHAAWNTRAADGWKREATAALADIADAIGTAALLGESHGAAIRRLIAERAAALAEVERLREALAEARRPSEAAARERIRRFLEREIDRDDYPLHLVPDGDGDSAPGKCGWAFWLVDGDPTSYVHEDLEIEWYGTAWKGEP